MFTQIGGHTVYCESRGDGAPAVVFIHGLGGSCSIWHAQATALSARHRTIVYDWAGSGCSSREPRLFTVDAWAEETVGLCKALGIESAVFAGHSLGCAVALTVAAANPQLARGVALFGPVLKLPDAAVPVILERAAKVRAEGMGPMADALPDSALAAVTRESNP
ncbi:MAG: alpha/beta fold hydrolase, partial [Bryobacteraceae bacterium]